WNMIGMQGTGSRRVVVRERTIPEYRILPLTGSQWRAPGHQPGHAVHSNPIYRGSPLTALEFAMHAVAVGGARGACDAFEETLKKNWNLPPFSQRFEMPEFQQTFGTAQALIDTAEAALLGIAGRSAGLQDGEELRRIHRAGAQCVELAWQATDLMFRSAGTSAASIQSRLGRSFRALAVLRTHI